MENRNIPHERHRIRPVVVAANHPREKYVVLEDQRLGIRSLPFRPVHSRPKTYITIGIQLPSEPNNVVHQV